MLECKVAYIKEDRNAILHQRYSIFIDEFKFFAPREDGKEVEFDCYDECSILIGVWKSDLLVASCRLVFPNNTVGLPTLNTMCIDSDKLIRTERTAEISRITVIATYRTFKNTIKVLQAMQQKINQIASNHNILQLIGSVEPSFLRLINHASLHYQEIGPLQYLIGAERFPVLLTLKEQL